MIAWIAKAAAGINPMALMVAALVGMSGYAGWKARDVIADSDAFTVQIKQADERAQLAAVAIRERDNALEKTRSLNELAAAAEAQAQRDRAKISKILGSIDNAKPLPAGCHLDDERLRQLREAP